MENKFTIFTRHLNSHHFLFADVTAHHITFDNKHHIIYKYVCVEKYTLYTREMGGIFPQLSTIFFFIS